MGKRPRGHPRKDWFHKSREERRGWTEPVQEFLLPAGPLDFDQGVTNLKDYFDLSSIEVTFNGTKLSQLSFKKLRD